MAQDEDTGQAEQDGRGPREFPPRRRNVGGQPRRRGGATPPRSSPAGSDGHPTAEDTGGYRAESAPAIVAPQWKRRIYIDRPADLAALAEELAQARLIAIDAEFSQVYTRSPNEPGHRLALLQLATDNEYRASFIVDALHLADLTPLQPALADARSLKLFHGIGADTRVLAARQLFPRHTLDLEAVSRSIFGQRESGLQSMLRRAAGVRLDKSLQRADWARRPLTPAMVAYAARDAEMTLVLHHWLSAHYAWAIALHEVGPDDPPPDVAPWIVPFLDGARPRHVAVALAEAGIAGDPRAQERDLRHALSTVRRPPQRARVMRLITDLELVALAPDFYPFATAAASEERAGAARALGRLRDSGAVPLIRPLLDDPVFDVRQAARLALESLANTRPARQQRPRPGGAIKWTSGADDAAQTGTDGWQAVLRASFGLPAPDDPTEAQ
jgi:hypothetical protein